MKRACITGFAGFVGRHFTKRLLEDGYGVVGVDDYSSGIRPFDGWPFLPAGDPDWWWKNGSFVGIESMVQDFVRDDEPDYDLIIHCAAVVGGRLKIDGEPLAVAMDLVVDASFFNWVVKAKNKPKVVYLSSSAVYPVQLQNSKSCIAMSESLTGFDGQGRIGIPDMTYGWAKLTGELLAQHAVKTYGADVVVYRPFSGYGEDQSFDYPFPSIIRRVVNRENPITIWGSGEQCRDFIHIDDIVEAVMQTKDVLKPGEVLNLGTGVATSFFDLVKTACSALKCWNDSIEGIIPRFQTASDTTKPEGVFYRVADTYKLNQFYKPKISLEEGIRRVAAYLKERANA